MPSALQVTSAAWALVSLGHTLSAKDWQSSPQFRALPSNADTCARAGWYQGSVFFLVNGASFQYLYFFINPVVFGACLGKSIVVLTQLRRSALLNYNWSKSPEQLRNPVNKAIAVLMVAVMWASSGWYFKRGVTSNGVAVAVMGALQAYSSLRE